MLLTAVLIPAAEGGFTALLSSRQYRRQTGLGRMNGPSQAIAEASRVALRSCRAVSRPAAVAVLPCRCVCLTRKPAHHRFRASPCVAAHSRHRHLPDVVWFERAARPQHRREDNRVLHFPPGSHERSPGIATSRMPRGRDLRLGSNELTGGRARYRNGDGGFLHLFGNLRKMLVLCRCLPLLRSESLHEV